MMPALLGNVIPKMQQIFESGVGLTYDQFGPEFASAQERFWAPWFRNALVSKVLPGLDGVVSKLEHGAKVADIGCGAAVGLVEMAKAYPTSEFYGFDNSENALSRATAIKAEAGITNVTFLNPDSDPLSEKPEYDLITTFDCIHDMAHPTQAILSIRRSLRGDGTWFVADIHAGDSLEENLAEDNPMLPMLYGFSVLCCLSSSMSTADGEGLGTLGFGEAKAKRMTEEAGFSRFKRMQDDPNNPLNAFYEIRP
jgi:ubiquinone/menaquinone biosynthesis C-methylase UbiE